MTPPKKLIEVALPFPEIHDASAYDKTPGRVGHVCGRSRREPDFAVTSVNCALAELPARAEVPS